VQFPGKEKGKNMLLLLQSRISNPETLGRPFCIFKHIKVEKDWLWISKMRYLPPANKSKTPWGELFKEEGMARLDLCTTTLSDMHGRCFAFFPERDDKAHLLWEQLKLWKMLPGWKTAKKGMIG
jgi:hypothetical protein